MAISLTFQHLIYQYWLLKLVLFFFQVIEQVNSQTLISQSQFASQEDWSIIDSYDEIYDEQIIECCQQNIFGGNQNQAIFKTFSLPPHYACEIEFQPFISTYENFKVLPYLDDQYYKDYQASYLIDQCENCIYYQLEQKIRYFAYHNRPTLQIQIILTNDDYFSVFDYSFLWGISNFTLWIYECPPQCEICNKFNQCEQWTQSKIYFWEQDISQIEGWQINNLPFGAIYSCGNFKFYGLINEFGVISFSSTILQDHSQIRIRFKLIAFPIFSNFFITILVNNEAEVYLYYDNSNSPWNAIYICDFAQIIVGVDVQFQHNVPDLLIQITIQGSTSNTYFGIRDFEIFTDTYTQEEVKIQEKKLCNDYNFNPFDGCFNFQFDCCDGCSSCVQGNCLECYSNWQYDTQNYYCIPFCGDGIIVGFEECDDSNFIPNDGCDYCQFSCPLNCLESKFGTCLNCNPFFQLVNNNCVPYIFNYENQYQLIEYFPPQLNCQLECIECVNKYCMKCMQGWDLLNFECFQQFNDQVPDFTQSQPICGDGIMQDREECDDGNTVPFDGCFECQYQCQYNCIECIEGVCLLLSELKEPIILNCDFGFHLIHQNCESICGDQIVASDEKCDDGNNEPFDGCFQCQYSCSLYCQDCYEGQCLNCDNGYQLSNNKCQELCGDGIKLSHEECDDGNILSFDGCSEKCQIENLWKCTTYDKEKSLCFQLDNPIVQLQYINMTFNKQFILMTSSQLVKIKESNENLTSNLQTQIIMVNNLDYIITLESQDEPTYEELKSIQYLFTIELLNQLEVDLIFQVSFNITLVNNYDLEIMNKVLQLKLKNPIVLNEQQKQVSSKASKFNLMILVILGLSSFIILLSGNPSDCFDVLDTLQYQSYLRFINIPFPENISIYFESSELISIQPFLISFNLAGLFQLAFTEEILESFGKFYFYSINADLLNNFQSQLCQIVFLILFTLFYCVYVQISQKKFLTPRQLQYLYEKNSKIIVIVVIFLYKIHKFILSFVKIFSLRGLKMWILANSWDVLFKIFLYLYSKPQNSLRTLLSIPLCIGIILIIFAISISYTFCTANNQKRRDLKIYQHQGLIVIKNSYSYFFQLRHKITQLFNVLQLHLQIPYIQEQLLQPICQKRTLIKLQFYGLKCQ